MITRDSIETAYSFLHQKRNVYIHSHLDWQRDDIEYAVAAFADDMSQELYERIADGLDDFLRDHQRFQTDITKAVLTLERFMEAPERQAVTPATRKTADNQDGLSADTY